MDRRRFLASCGAIAACPLPQSPRPKSGKVVLITDWKVRAYRETETYGHLFGSVSYRLPCVEWPTWSLWNGGVMPLFLGHGVRLHAMRLHRQWVPLLLVPAGVTVKFADGCKKIAVVEWDHK